MQQVHNVPGIRCYSLQNLKISLHGLHSSPCGCDQKESPRKMKNKNVVCLSRECSSTPVGYGQEFLSKEKCDNTVSPPYSPDLHPVDFCLYFRIKSALKWPLFCEAADIIKNEKNDLKSFSQRG